MLSESDVAEQIRRIWSRLDTDIEVVSILLHDNTIHVGLSGDTNADAVERALAVVFDGTPVSVAVVPDALLPLIVGVSQRKWAYDDALQLDDPELDRIDRALREIDAVSECRAVSYGHPATDLLHIGIIGRTAGFTYSDQRELARALSVGDVKLVHIHANDNRGYLPRSPKLVVGQWIRGGW